MTSPNSQPDFQVNDTPDIAGVSSVPQPVRPPVDYSGRGQVADPAAFAGSAGSGRGGGRSGSRGSGRRSGLGSILGILGEILLTLAVVCALYIVWQLWWTGVVAEQTQTRQISQSSWVQPAKSGSSYRIAAAQKGAPPLDPALSGKPATGALVGQIYIPRFGAEWKRLVVQGTDLTQLARHGMGHYESSQMPGQLGNFAVAGHRSGYGEPLANVPDLQPGDPIVVRTDNYWYVYHYTNYEIVLPTQAAVVAPVPNHPGQTPTKRLITLTTCNPRYSTATHRWISYGVLDYWAKVSDGIPKQLATTGPGGAVSFVQNDTKTLTSQIPPLTSILIWLLMAYLIIYLAAALTWRYPATRRARLRAAERAAQDEWKSQHADQDVAAMPTFQASLRRRSASLYGWVYRHHPGVAIIRLLLMVLLVLIAAVLLFQWGFPWLATHVPYLQLSSNYVSVG